VAVDDKPINKEKAVNNKRLSFLRFQQKLVRTLPDSSV
jgi:hypothetical protein